MKSSSYIDLQRFMLIPTKFPLSPLSNFFTFPPITRKSRLRLEIRISLFLAFLLSGATRIRTGDTRIFSPMLYLLSYGTIVSELRCKSSQYFHNSQALRRLFSKKHGFSANHRIFTIVRHTKNTSSALYLQNSLLQSETATTAICTK